MGTIKQEKILLEIKANRTALVSLLIQESKADFQPTLDFTVISLVEVPWSTNGKRES